MTEADREIETTEAPQSISGMEGEDRAMKLVGEMLAGKIVDVRPQLDFTTELGFIYPIAEQTLGVKGKEAVSILESLTDRGILKKNFFDRLLRCPRCQSINIRPTIHCPKCGSGDIVQGRVLEHLACKYVGLEGEFLTGGRYVCPKCKVELRTLGVDYQSQGVLRKCHNCGDVSSVPLIKWRCLKCSTLTDVGGVGEVTIYSYSLDEAKRNWLEFELRPKLQFLEFLRQSGYEVTENARLKGKSGAVHCIDILATRDVGVVTHNIAIGIGIARDKVRLDRILDFDVKAYDSGIHDKVMIISPGLGEEAGKFASHQRIKVLEPKDLEIVLTRGSKPGREIIKEPFEFKSKSQLIQYLEKQGYTVKKNFKVEGRSGAAHNIDILATKDEGIINHRIAIGIVMGKKPLGLDKVFKFDDKAYDAGILDKVLIAVPGLTREARQFAKHQGTRVFEVGQLGPSGEGTPES